MRQLGHGQDSGLEVLRIGPGAHRGALLAVALAFGRDHQLFDHVTGRERQLGHLAFAVAGDFEPGRKRIGHAHTHTVQATREAVGTALALVELAARVQAGEHQFHDGSVFFGMQADGNAAPVVLDGNAAVRVQRDLDLLAVAGQCLVCGVINDLLHDVQGVFGSGVHARALAHGLQPLQDANGRLGVTWSGQVIPNICGKKPTFYG
ncbi:hypothetical protein D9M69_567140 [compost metagenome]